MRIGEIYIKYKIPSNLQKHMLKVCGIADFIEKHWKGADKVDFLLTKKVCLVHDLGNIVKFEEITDTSVMIDQRWLDLDI